MQDFKHIQAWQRAHAFAVDVHRLARHFSRAGFSRLRAQLTGAAESVGDNITEGAGADTNSEFARYLDISVKSANETEHHLLKARDFGLIDESEWRRFTDEIIEIRKMTYGYRQRILKSDRTPSRER